MKLDDINVNRATPDQLKRLINQEMDSIAKGDSFETHEAIASYIINEMLNEQQIKHLVEYLNL